MVKAVSETGERRHRAEVLKVYTIAQSNGSIGSSETTYRLPIASHAIFAGLEGRNSSKPAV